MKKTLYQILGVDAKASSRDIAAAYASLSAKTDWPDPDMAGLLRAANEVLSDPRQREAYDASIAHAEAAASEPAWDPEPTFLEAWGKWIAAIAILIVVAVWLAARKDMPPAPEAAPEAVSKPVNGQPLDAAPRSEAPAPGAPARPAEPKEPAPSAPSSSAPSAPTGRSAEDVFSDVAPRVARVNVMDVSGRVIGTGSGVVIEHAVLITSCHVATLGAKLAVKFGGEIMPATIAMADEALDLCRLSVPAMRAPAARIGSVATLRTGQRVYAIGAPAGLDLTISEGIVSALRKVDEGTVIQTTAPISPGSSGGGLFDVSGELVGVMTFQHRFGQNLNFALPADWIGQMRARSATEPSWRATSVADRSQELPPATLILGRWLCRDWTSGRTAHYDFEVDGRVGISTTDSDAATLKYGVSGKTLQMSDEKLAVTLAIDELTGRKMILHGRDKSVACERR